MKKFITIGLLALSLVSVKAASITVTLLNGAATNLSVANQINAPVVVTTVLLSANTTNSSVQFLDAPAMALTYTIAAYTNTLTYASNVISSYINYFGATNTTTNLQAVTTVLTNAAVTTNFQTRFQASALASTTYTIDGANYNFNNGVLITNNSSGIATITINYLK